ncbi:MAG: metallopeptidase TldD-related protein [Cellulosilyticaceae bacterium]
MITQIKEVLGILGIDTYLIECKKQESVELFFVKRALDMTRKKDVQKYGVTVYRDFEKDGKKMRGYSSIKVYESMTKEEIEEVLKDAYYAASFVENPYYPLPSGSKEEKVQGTGDLSKYTLEESAKCLVKALYAYSEESTCFLNSAELFIYKTENHILNSEGIDVCYEQFKVSGEMVAQCTESQDVETYKSFSYDALVPEVLTKLVEDTLELTKARSQAVTGPKQGSYPVILAGEYIGTLLSYYLDRAGTNMIYPKYSNFKVGDQIQGKDLKGDTLNIKVKAEVPYSNEGIPMMDRAFVDKGQLQVVHGPSRFAHYLEVEPTGYYSSIVVPEGEVALEDLKQGECLYIVNFSDFQMDAFTGNFGGEIRLAFYSDGETVVPVTGGSLSGSIQSIQENLSFAKEVYVGEHYTGPKAVRFEGATIAGC